MKIRSDFVTNSSSSSFICISKVNMNDELKSYMKEEFGKYGIGLLEKYVSKGSEIMSEDYNEIKELIEDYGQTIEINPDTYYLSARFIAYTNEGDTEGDDAFLYRHIPDQYKEEIYEGDSD